MNKNWEAKPSNQDVTHTTTQNHTGPAGCMWRLRALELPYTYRKDPPAMACTFRSTEHEELEDEERRNELY